jgi:uncharacterized membrane protein YhaH (DUF805 family)
MSEQRGSGKTMTALVREYWQSALGMLIAGAATFAITFGSYESYRDHGSLELDMAGVTLTLILWLAVGIAAGFVSGRLRDAIGSWIASVVGVLIAYAVFYLVVHPDAVYASKGGFTADIGSIALFLAGFISLGHVVGVYAREYVRADEEAPPPS